MLRILIIAALLLAGCQPAAQVAAEPEPRVDYSNAPEWVKANPLDRKPQSFGAPPAGAPLPPIVIAKADDMLPALAGELTVDGWGPIRIGMTLDEVNAATDSKLSVQGDPEYEDGQCTFLYPKGTPEGFSVMFVEGRVTRIDIDKPGPVTYGELGIGASGADVRRVFGDKLNRESHFYVGKPAEYLTVWTIASPDLPNGATPTPEFWASTQKARGVRFETDVDGKVTTFRAGDGSIKWVEGCS